MAGLRRCHGALTSSCSSCDAPSMNSCIARQYCAPPKRRLPACSHIVAASPSGSAPLSARAAADSSIAASPTLAAADPPLLMTLRPRLLASVEACCLSAASGRLISQSAPECDMLISCCRVSPWVAGSRAIDPRRSWCTERQNRWTKSSSVSPSASGGACSCFCKVCSCASTDWEAALRSSCHRWSMCGWSAPRRATTPFPR